SLGEPTRSLALSSGLLAVLAVASRPLSSRRVQRWLECRDPRLRGFRADRPGQAQAGDHEDDPDATEGGGHAQTELERGGRCGTHTQLANEGKRGGAPGDAAGGGLDRISAIELAVVLAIDAERDLRAGRIEGA